MLSTDKQTNRQTNRQTDRQTNQRYQKHNLLCQGGNNNNNLFIKHIFHTICSKAHKIRDKTLGHDGFCFLGYR